MVESYQEAANAAKNAKGSEYQLSIMSFKTIFSFRKNEY